jgi:hypothetical protein
MRPQQALTLTSKLSMTLDTHTVPLINEDTDNEFTISVLSDNPIDTAELMLEEQGYEDLVVDEDRLDEDDPTGTALTKASPTDARQQAMQRASPEQDSTGAPEPPNFDAFQPHHLMADPNSDGNGDTDGDSDGSHNTGAGSDNNDNDGGGEPHNTDKTANTSNTVASNTTDNTDTTSTTGTTDNTANTEHTPADILEANAELFRDKNDDYGQAWRLAGETMAEWAQENDIRSVDITDERELVSLCLFIQRLHKLIRAFNLEFQSIEPNNESLFESHRDSSTYAAMHAAYTDDVYNGGDSFDG